MIKIKHEEVRGSLKHYILQFSDAKFQENIWTNPGNVPMNQSGTLDQCISELFDITSFDDPSFIEASQGRVFYANEIPLMKNLSSLIMSVIGDLGDVDVKLYLADPRWPSVRLIANDLLRAMTENDR